MAIRSGGASAGGGSSRPERYAEWSRTRPNTTAMYDVGIFAARNAPNRAPVVVAISRNIPMRMLENPSLTYATAAPDEVAITDTSDAPMA